MSTEMDDFWVTADEIAYPEDDPHLCTDYELCPHCGQCHACCGCY